MRSWRSQAAAAFVDGGRLEEEHLHRLKVRGAGAADCAGGRQGEGDIVPALATALAQFGAADEGQLRLAALAGGGQPGLVMRRPVGAGDAVAHREFRSHGLFRLDGDGQIALGGAGAALLRPCPLQRRDLRRDIVDADARTAQLSLDLDQRGADGIEHGRPIRDRQGLAIGPELLRPGLGEALDGAALGLDGDDLALQPGLLLAQRLELGLDGLVQPHPGVSRHELHIDSADREGAVALGLDADRGGVDRGRQAAQHQLRCARPSARPGRAASPPPHPDRP